MKQLQQLQNPDCAPCSCLLQCTPTSTFCPTISRRKNRRATFILQLSTRLWCGDFRLFSWQSAARSRCRRFGLLLTGPWRWRLWLYARHSTLSVTSKIC